uniref:Uncharacterized protein n=1 Tax=Tetraselmis sp. GSL018 TaxID=582737 RepID=A0A061RIU3_9CHLO
MRRSCARLQGFRRIPSSHAPKPCPDMEQAQLHYLGVDSGTFLHPSVGRRCWQHPVGGGGSRQPQEGHG